MINSSVEEWRDIPGFEGAYQASTFGNIRSVKRVVVRSDGKRMTYKSRILKPGLSDNGYYTVDIKSHSYYIHRLVAETFLPNPNNFHEVNHKSEIKTDNHVWNLEWCTHRYNNKYGTKSERTATKNSRKVAQYNKQGELIGVYKSIAYAAKVLGYKYNGNIYACCNGKIKTAFNYIWKYEKSFDQE